METLSFSLKNGQTLEIRLGQESDADQLSQLVHNVFATSPYVVTTPAEFEKSKESTQERIRKLTLHPNEIVLVASINDELVGNLDFICGKRKRLEHAGEIGMGLHEDFRGLGIGQLLLKVFLDWAKLNPNLTKVKLGVFEENYPAIHIYKKFGFEVEGKKVNEVRMADGTYHTIIEMYQLV